MLTHLVFARSLLGAPIRFWPDGVPARWSHVGILVPAQEGDDAYPWVWVARIGRKFGPVQWPAFTRRYDGYEVVAYDVPDLASGLAWLEANRGKPYGVLTVLARALGLSHGEDRADHCSEAAETFLAACGLRRWRGDLHRVSPNQSYHNTCGVAQ